MSHIRSSFEFSPRQSITFFFSFRFVYSFHFFSMYSAHIAWGKVFVIFFPFFISSCKPKQVCIKISSNFIQWKTSIQPFFALTSEQVNQTRKQTKAKQRRKNETRTGYFSFATGEKTNIKVQAEKLLTIETCPQLTDFFLHSLAIAPAHYLSREKETNISFYHIERQKVYA